MVRISIVGLVGLPGAGKTTAADYLEKKGFSHVILSDFIKEEARKSGREVITREDLQEYGNRMRETYGPQILAQLASKKIRQNGFRRVVIDGIRNLYEVAFLQVENHFTLVGITAGPKIRYERLTQRRNRPHEETYEEFLEHEHREDALGSREIGLRVRECLKKAKYTISNNTTRDAFLTSLDAFVKLLPFLQKP